MPKPTREDVIGYLEFAGKNNYALNPIAAGLKARLVVMCNAYLAQDVEIETKNSNLHPSADLLDTTLKQMAELKAEIHGLTGTIKALDTELRRMKGLTHVKADE